VWFVNGFSRHPNSERQSLDKLSGEMECHGVQSVPVGDWQGVQFRVVDPAKGIVTEWRKRGYAVP